MYLKSIEIENFRNIKRLKTTFNKSYNVFYGENAQGKTNLLEAIHLTLNGLSHREKKSKNFINHNSENAQIKAEVFSENFYDSTIELNIKDKREYYILKEKVSRRSLLLKTYNIIIFTPLDLKVVKDSPLHKRNFLDESISSLYPGYDNAVKSYNKILKQRNALLKTNKSDKNILTEVYDDTLAKIGKDIIIARINFLKKLKVTCNNLNNEVAKDEKIQFFYISNILKENTDLKNLENTYKEALRNSLKDDILRGYTTKGISHDDITITLNEQDAKLFASQGQQRSIALCMKLSLIKMLYEKNNEYPIVLLDDVMSDLDINRQKQIITLLKNLQSFITTVDIKFMEDVKNKNIYEIKKGNLYI